MTLIIGNGESRKHIDIEKLDFFKIGCNAITRDYKVDLVSCCDKSMVRESIDRGVNQHTPIFTRDKWKSYFNNAYNINYYPTLPYSGSQRADNPFHWGSGPYAVLLSATRNNCTNHLIGFDLYSTDGLQNNVYKDTDNYQSSSKKAVDPRYWIYQIGKIIEIFSEQKFVIYNNDDWQMPESWNKPNLIFDKIENLL